MILHKFTTKRYRWFYSKHFLKSLHIIHTWKVFFWKIEHKHKHFLQEHKTSYLLQNWQTLTSRLIMHLSFSLSIMSHRAFFLKLTPFISKSLQSARFRQSSLSLNPIEHTAQRCVGFYFTSFNTQAHFQPNFTAIWIGWIWLRPLRDHSSFPSSWGRLRSEKKMRGIKECMECMRQ